jgi:hypothetical protein
LYCKKVFQVSCFHGKSFRRNIFFVISSYGKLILFKDNIMIKNDYFFSQSFSNPTGWQQGHESGNPFVAFNATPRSEIGHDNNCKISHESS